MILSSPNRRAKEKGKKIADNLSYLWGKCGVNVRWNIPLCELIKTPRMAKLRQPRLSDTTCKMLDYGAFYELL
jgi:hypothetical protein